MKGTFGARAYAFYLQLARPRVPRGVKVMNPYRDTRVQGYLRAFLDRYFDDTRERTLVFGINPGRLGAGITGVTEELAAGVAGGVQGGADLEQQVLGVQRAPAAAGVAGAQQVGALPRTGSGGDDGRSSGLLIAGIALAILGGALVSARVLARR